MRLKWRALVLALGDVLLLYLALAAALTMREGHLFSVEFFLLHVPVFSIVFALWIGVFYSLGLYDFQRMRDLITIISDALLALFVNVLFSTGIFYLFAPYLGMTPKTNLFLAAVFGHSAVLLWRHLWVRILSSTIMAQRVAFWAESPLIRAMVADLQARPHLGFKPVDAGPFSALSERTSQGASWIRSAGGRLNLKTSIDLLVMHSGRLEENPALGREVFSLAVREDIPVMTHLDFYEKVYRKIPPNHAAQPSWLLTHVLPKENQVYAWTKRAMDFLGSFLGLVLLSPLLALIILASLCFDRAGSPLYWQSRVGLLGTEFFIWKFRTMIPKADSAGPLWTMAPEDGRVTPFGKLLRRFRLDELPQLWNVLAGDMSLVGPRPEWTEEVRVLEHKVPHYHLRHLVKPGITGWAQINFRATNSPEDSQEKLHYDLYYVKNISLALDIGILLKTVKRVFVRDEEFEKGPSSIPAGLGAKASDSPKGSA